MQPAQLTNAVKAEARRLGFTMAGACPAVTPEGITRFHEWLDRGYAGEMYYLQERADAYEHPSGVLDGARSLLMLAMNYRTAEPARPKIGEGRVARYAWGNDYHDVIHDRLHVLADYLRELYPGAAVRGVVDTAPLLERQFAQSAGLGWLGKNTLLLNRDEGSWFFLAALLTDVELDYDSPHETDHCGSCTACLDACPTDAFVAPYVLDSRRCISYLTIELKSQIPSELREGIGDWLFGCDVCQEVCPWNHRAPVSTESQFGPHNATTVTLAELFSLDDAEFRRRYRETPLWRPKRAGLLRNAAILLGNRQHPETLSALVTGLNDREPLVRGASAWAIGRHDEAASTEALRARLHLETDDAVRQEILSALETAKL